MTATAPEAVAPIVDLIHCVGGTSIGEELGLLISPPNAEKGCILPQVREQVHRQLDDDLETLRAKGQELTGVNPVVLAQLMGKLDLLDTTRNQTDSASWEERVLDELRGIERILENGLNLRQELNERCEDFLCSSLKTIRDAISSVAHLKALTDLARLSADGLTRTVVHYARPEVLCAVRNARGLDPQKCDVIIIGGGPAGIAALYNAGMHGVDAVLLEGGYLGQGMSDARAKPVHLMRTNAAGSSLFRTPPLSPAVVNTVGMPALMEALQLRALASRARDSLAAETGISFPQLLPGANEPVNSPGPVTRGEVYAYFCEVAQRAASFNTCFLLEQSPVTEVTWNAEEQSFLVRSSDGHELRSKFLIVATGFVGSDAEYARGIPDILKLCETRKGSYVVITSENDLQRIALFEHTGPRVQGETLSPQLVISDSILGHPEVLAHLAALPAGQRLAVIGSGESAAKSVVELLAHHSSICVDLFVKAKLEPSQSQVPNFRGSGDLSLRSILDRDLGERTVELWKRHFGTPITAETMYEILGHVRAGRVRVFELGTHFDEQALDLVTRRMGDRFVTEVRIDARNTSVSTHLEEQVAEWKAVGLVADEYSLIDKEDPARLAVIDGPIVVAAGYDRQRLHMQDSLFRQLANQGLIEICDEPGSVLRGEVELERLFSVRNQRLAFAGAANVLGFADGGFGGAGMRAGLIMAEIARELGKDSQPDSKSISLNAATVDVPVNTEMRFPGTHFLNQIAAREARGERLSPEEQLMLRRADGLSARIGRELVKCGLG